MINTSNNHHLNLMNTSNMLYQQLVNTSNCLYGFNIESSNALYEFIHTDGDSTKGVINVARRGGDTDTNCAIAGVILGTAIGYTNINRRLMMLLANYKWLESHVMNVVSSL